MRVPAAGNLLAGYGAIHHPDPEEALWLSTLFHRVVIWCYLTRRGDTSDGSAGLVRDLDEMSRSKGATYPVLQGRGLLLRTLQNVEMAGNSCFIRRDETPLRELTSSDGRTFGG
jgi:hypothetical protein